MKFIFLLLFACTALAGDFALRDGDTCIFLGDSITAARDSSKVVENHTSFASLNPKPAS